MTDGYWDKLKAEHPDVTQGEIDESTRLLIEKGLIKWDKATQTPRLTAAGKAEALSRWPHLSAGNN